MEAAMFGDTLGWIFGALLLLVLIFYVLDYLGLVDFIDAIVALFGLAVGVVGMIAALLIWSARKLLAPAKTPVPSDGPQGKAPEEGPAVRRAGIETRTMARQRGRI